MRDGTLQPWAGSSVTLPPSGSEREGESRHQQQRHRGAHAQGSRSGTRGASANRRRRRRGWRPCALVRRQSARRRSLTVAPGPAGRSVPGLGYGELVGALDAAIDFGRRRRRKTRSGKSEASDDTPQEITARESGEIGRTRKTPSQDRLRNRPATRRKRSTSGRAAFHNDGRRMAKRVRVRPGRQPEVSLTQSFSSSAFPGAAQTRSQDRKIAEKAAKARRFPKS